MEGIEKKETKCMFNNFFFVFCLFMYAIMCDEEENAIHVAINDVEEGHSRELKVEYAWHAT